MPGKTDKIDGNRAADKPVILIDGHDAGYLTLLAHALDIEGFLVLQAAGPDPSGPSNTAGLQDGSPQGRYSEDVHPDHAQPNDKAVPSVLVHGAAADTTAFTKSIPAADAIVLDYGSSGPSALGALRRIRAQRETACIPVVLLTDAASMEPVTTLPVDGAQDHYVHRAAGATQIIAGIRRALKSKAPNAGHLDYAGIRMDTQRHRVRRAGREIRLTRIEFQLLRHFLAHPEHVFTRQELLKAAWPQQVKVETRTVDVHVGRLRRALGASSDHDLIRTVRGIGYSLSEE